MVSETRKSATPPYIAFPTFLSFIKGLGEAGVPSRIDKSLLRNMSGSNQSALLSALKWFGLIDEAGAHGARLESLVKAGDKAGAVIKTMLPEAYDFLADGSIDVGRATGAQLEEKFRAYGLSGETVGKAMSFFLAACKEAAIPVSSHIKLPKVVRANGQAKVKKGARVQSAEEEAREEEDEEEAGTSPVMKFEIPIPINRKVKISIPADFDGDDWTLLQAMFTAYIARWKNMKEGGGT